MTRRGPAPTRIVRSALAVFALTSIALAAACGGGGGGGKEATSTGGTATSSAGGLVAGYSECPPPGSASELTGAGSTFINPLMSKWAADYNQDCKTRVNYQSIGSGGGIQQITQKTVDFGASDGIMTDQQEQAAKAAGGDIMHIIVTSGSLAVVYNLPGVSRGQLKLDGPTLADIYLGNIKKWNDPKIAALNPGLNLPGSDIAVVHRSDGSGTTFIFTNYLSKVSPQWQANVGFATSVNWPAGVGGQGNEGVAGQVRQLPGGIGYVELAYAVQNNLPWAQMKNKSGTFLEPSLAGTTAAAAVPIPADMKVLVTDSENPQAYPIAGFTWALVYVNQPDAAKGKTLASFLWWAIHDGQKEATALNYGPLSADVVKAAEAQVLKMQCGGSACLTK
jgi:phosphate transport system substrate-binding protein